MLIKGPVQSLQCKCLLSEVGAITPKGLGIALPMAQHNAITLKDKGTSENSQLKN